MSDCAPWNYFVNLLRYKQKFLEVLDFLNANEDAQVTSIAEASVITICAWDVGGQMVSPEKELERKLTTGVCRKDR